MKGRKSEPLSLLHRNKVLLEIHAFYVNFVISAKTSLAEHGVCTRQGYRLRSPAPTTFYDANPAEELDPCLMMMTT